jgi:hypothetical protein
VVSLTLAGCVGVTSSGWDDGGDTGGLDSSAGSLGDMAGSGHSTDLAHGSGDMSQNFIAGGIGPHGGSVDLLHFGISGDTRPPSCEDTAGYPTGVIDSIGDAFRNAQVQFALDLGDHMYVCNNDLSIATAQMNLFLDGTRHYGGTWFMTEGNHECYGGFCPAGSTNANYVAFMTALAPISPMPYYSVDVNTRFGLATFVFIADNSWDGTQQSWLESTLSAADASARYTLVARHHPEGDTSVSTNAAIMTVIRAHKFSLFLTGHSHLYKHMTTDGGRDLVMGNSGAPLIAGGSFYGYGIIDQQTDQTLKLSIFDVTTGNLMDSWSVQPN